MQKIEKNCDKNNNLQLTGIIDMCHAKEISLY